MYHTRSTNTLDKENEEAASSRILTRQQSSSSLIPRTPSKQQLAQGQPPPAQGPPLKPTTAAAAYPGTPSHPAKQPTTAPSTPTGHSILRAKTNQQQIPSTPGGSQGGANKSQQTATKKRAFARTFSATTITTNTTASAAEATTLETKANQGHPPSILTSPNIAAIAGDTRRKSLTRRGSNIRERLIVHRDEPSTQASEVASGVAISPSQTAAEGQGGTSSALGSSMSTATLGRTSLRKKSLIRRETVAEQARENATTTLAMERSQASSDKVVVGEGKTESKRRALSKQKDIEVEYCPPRQQEQPYECEVEIDKRVFELHPPALAYYVGGIKDFDLPDPSFEPAETRRRPGLVTVEDPEEHAVSKDTDRKDDEPDNAHDQLDRPPTGSSQKDAHADEESELESTLHPQGSPTTFGIADLHNTFKTRPPFDGFLFDVDPSDDEDTPALSLVTETQKGVVSARVAPRPVSTRRGVKPTVKPTQPVVMTTKQVRTKAASRLMTTSANTASRTAPERVQRTLSTVKPPISSSSSTRAMPPAPPSKASPSTPTTTAAKVDTMLLKDIGLDDLEDSSKVETSFSDFQFDL